ncbi:MAG: LOG family protein [Candidatus Hydrogenedentes bacterium]|nr:LOG family protein [Candidatus Hydrogenedentota bacterium]
MEHENIESAAAPGKAYKNLNFLNSPDARTVRMLCEFLEPQARFRKHQIRDTIVFFGSARIPAPDDAQSHLVNLQEQAKHKEKTPELDLALQQAERRLKMARYYEDAARLAERMTEWAMALPQKNWRFIVCSGGGPGIMEAANLGAKRAKGLSVSLNISLPFEQKPNKHQTRDLAFEFHYFFMRKFWFVYLAKALVVFPGGFGTMDELFEVLTLIQTQKTSKTMPVVIYGSEYWNEIVNFDAFVKWGMISPDDLNLFRLCDTVDDAFDYLTSELTRLYLKGKK